MKADPPTCKYYITVHDTRGLYLFTMHIYLFPGTLILLESRNNPNAVSCLPSHQMIHFIQQASTNPTDIGLTRIGCHIIIIIIITIIITVTTITCLCETMEITLWRHVAIIKHYKSNLKCLLIRRNHKTEQETYVSTGHEQSL